MDVSFTNVLEGARQYFQGLPPAAAAPAAPHATDAHAPDAHQQQVHPSVYNTAPPIAAVSAAQQIPPTATAGHAHYQNNHYRAAATPAHNTQHLNHHNQQQQQQQPKPQTYHTNQQTPVTSAYAQQVPPPAPSNAYWGTDPATTLNSPAPHYNNNTQVRSNAYPPASTVYHHPHSSGASTTPTPTYAPHHYQRPAPQQHHMPPYTQATPPTTSSYYTLQKPLYSAPPATHTYAAQTPNTYYQQQAPRNTVSAPIRSQNANVTPPQQRSQSTILPAQQQQQQTPPMGGNYQHRLPVLPTDIYHNRTSSVTTSNNRTPTSRPISVISPNYQHVDYSRPSVVENGALHYKNTYMPKYSANTYSAATTVATTNEYSAPKSTQAPLDLSVKTIKSHADSSTLVDHSDDRNYRQSAVRAPKIDFAPNFTLPNAQKQTEAESPNPANKYYYQYSASTNSANSLNRREPLPRIEFPSVENAYPRENTELCGAGRKRSSLESGVTAASYGIPEKMPKIDTWRQTIDQQIEQRLSSYKSARSLHEQQQVQQNRPPVSTQPSVNMLNGGNGTLSAHGAAQRPPTKYHYSNNSNFPRPQYPQTYQRPPVAQKPPLTPPKQQAANKNVINLLRNSIQSKGVAKEAAQRKMDIQQQVNNCREIQQPSTDVMAPLQPKLGIVGRRNVSPFTAASLDKNATTPMGGYKLHMPKAIDSVIFSSDDKVVETAESQQASMGGQQATPVGGAATTTPATSDLDGLAAFLAARIRTKAELKQVTPGSERAAETGRTTPKRIWTPTTTDVAAKLKARGSGGEQGSVRSSSETSVFDFPDSDNEASLTEGGLERLRKDRKAIAASTVPPPPTTMNTQAEDVIEAVVVAEEQNDTPKVQNEEEQRPLSPFDLLFSQTCDSFMEQLRNGCGKKRGRRKKLSGTPPTDVSDLTPVKVVIKQEQPDEDEVPEPPQKLIEVRRRESVVDIRLEAQIKVETVEETPMGGTDAAKGKEDGGNVIVNDITIKVEVEDVGYSTGGATQTTTTTTEVRSAVEIKVERAESADSDSDTPLIVCKNKIKSKMAAAAAVITTEDVRDAEMTAGEEKGGSSDSELDGIAGSLTIRKKKEVKRNLFDVKTTATTTTIPITICKPGKKPSFGDGTDFHPGWEEELYRYKKALRMPRMLIQVTRYKLFSLIQRPPNCQRLSTSLPDLDPCPLSPTLSSITDGGQTDKSIGDSTTKKKSKPESLDTSDLDSNCSFNFSLGAKTNYDSEEGSVKSCSMSNATAAAQKNGGILDRLLEKYGAKKRKRYTLKKPLIEEKTVKILTKGESRVELLPTPSLEVRESETKSGSPVVKSESVLLGFRKKTMNNFKDAFINNTNKIVGVSEFTTVVLKSRTRTETRVLKEKATIREVFGEDRPASAPPVTCLDEEIVLKDDKPPPSEAKKQPPKETLSNLFQRSLLNKIKTEIIDDDEMIDVKKEDDAKTDISSLDDGDVTSVIKKRSKLRSIRRKFSSGFDYIRKKKKVVKKEGAESRSGTPVAEAPPTSDPQTPATPHVGRPPKIRRSGPIAAKASPESVQDIQKEIKMWVLNKGIGETHLHRAARCGYTDITAYCLEHMQHNPSPKDNAGYTPLHEACSRGHLDIARLLLQYGALVSESAQGGIRPLHEAAENGHLEIVRLLLSYGADATLATYGGSTPLQLSTDDATSEALLQHLGDLKGESDKAWTFRGPSTCFDNLQELGYDPLTDMPAPDPPIEQEDMELEISEHMLPNLYSLPPSAPVGVAATVHGSERWVLLQDLSAALKIKSKETLLRQLNLVGGAGPPKGVDQDGVREMRTAEFLEKARCCQFLHANEKLNTRATKVCLVRYTDKVRQLLNVERTVINVR